MQQREAVEHTEGVLCDNIGTGLRYIAAWLPGSGGRPVRGRIKDAATVEFSRAQIWQQIQHGVVLREGAKVTKELFRHLLRKELMTLRFEVGNDSFRKGKFGDAALLFDALVTGDEFVNFLTSRAYVHPRFDVGNRS